MRASDFAAKKLDHSRAFYIRRVKSALLPAGSKFH
jgi:hypothetical protein